MGRGTSVKHVQVASASKIQPNPPRYLVLCVGDSVQCRQIRSFPTLQIRKAPQISYNAVSGTRPQSLCHFALHSATCAMLMAHFVPLHHLHITYRTGLFFITHPPSRSHWRWTTPQYKPNHTCNTFNSEQLLNKSCTAA